MNRWGKRLIVVLLLLFPSISLWFLWGKDDLENTAGIPIVFSASMMISCYFSIYLDRYIPRISGLWIRSQKKRLQGLADRLGVSIEDHEKEARSGSFVWWVWSRRLFLYSCVSVVIFLSDIAFFVILGDAAYLLIVSRYLVRWLVIYSIFALLSLVSVLAPMVHVEVLLWYIKRRLDRRSLESQRRLERLNQQQRDFERRITRPVVFAPGIVSLA